MYKQILSQFLDALLPRRCVGCLRYDAWACDDCVAASQRRHQTTLPESSVLSIQTLGPYHDPFWRHSIELLKFRGIKEVAIPLGLALAEYIDELDTSFDNAIIIPMPLHPRRVCERGYNQATLLSEIISQSLDIPLLDNLLVRIKSTRAQAQISNPIERFNNVSKAFSLNDQIRAERVLAGKTVYLIDDVVTTGATALAAVKVLQKAGVRKIELYAVARGS